MDKFGLIGQNLSHSFSHSFFTKKFEDENINAQYLNFDINYIEQILDIINVEKELKGFNVTIPYKEKIIPFLSFISENAKKIGAVNVVKIIRKNKNIELHGYNSDYIGFRDSIKPLIKDEKKALILGTGGASKSISMALSQMNIICQSVSRSNNTKSISYSNLTNSIILDHKIIVNTTPLGTYPNTQTFPDIPYQSITSNHILYDLVYNPPETIFLKQGIIKGAKVKNGYEMLKIQALESWKIWNN